MAITSIGGFLDKVAEFDRQLEKHYARLRDETQDEGVRLLTYYFAKNRNHLTTALHDLSPVQLKHVRRMPLKLNLEATPFVQYPLLNTPVGEINGQQLLEAVIQYEEALISFYRRTREQLGTKEAEDLFDSLIRVE